MARRQFYVYIVSNYGRTVFYTGVTNNIARRITEHRNNQSIFTARYKCHYLMYYEIYTKVLRAIAREKQLKNWKRQWKIELIRKENPELIDLSLTWE